MSTTKELKRSMYGKLAAWKIYATTTESFEKTLETYLEALSRDRNDLERRLAQMTEERDDIQLRLHAVDHAYTEQQSSATLASTLKENSKLMALVIRQRHFIQTLYTSRKARKPRPATMAQRSRENASGDELKLSAGHSEATVQQLRQQIDALELSRRSWMDEAKSLEARLSGFVDRKPVAWIKHLKGSECKSDGRTYDLMFCPMDGYRPLFDSPEAAPASDVMCRGDARLGTACGKCSRCERAKSIESLAETIYETWSTYAGYVPWVERGNSAKQEEARQIASRTFELALANQVDPAQLR